MPLRAKVSQRRAQEVRRNFEVMIGLKRAVAARANVVQHENAADAREKRPQQVMRAGEIQRFQPGADDVVAELLHYYRWPVGIRVKLAEKR